MEEYLRNGNAKNLIAYYHMLFWRINSGVYIQKTLGDINRMHELATNMNSKYILYCAKKQLQEKLDIIYKKGHFLLSENQGSIEKASRTEEKLATLNHEGIDLAYAF